MRLALFPEQTQHLRIGPVLRTDRRSLPVLAHRVFSVRRGIWSLSAHSGL
jgi:hypothetical protein